MNIKVKVSIVALWMWVTLFMTVPTLLVSITSMLTYDPIHLFRWPMTLDNYISLLDPLYLKVFARSFLFSTGCTFLCLFFGYPLAYAMATASPRLKPWLVIGLTIPFWTSLLVRTYTIGIFLKAHGVVNTLLIKAHILSQPLQLLYTPFAVMLGLVYTLLPFMVMPLYSSLERFDMSLIEAAYDLGANKIKILFKILIPLTRSSILTGTALVFLPSMTLFYLPNLLGGSKHLLIGNLIENQFLQITHWPLGAATCTLLFIITLGLFKAIDHESLS